jgi:long-chain acyl-CoA synthetase
MCDFSQLNFRSAEALVTSEGKVYTYTQAEEHSDSFASFLHPKALVFILAENCPESVIAYLGCLRARTPAALLAGNIHREFLADLLRLYRPQFVWMNRRRIDEISDAREVFSWNDYVLVQYASDSLDVHADLALLMTTSGSTGNRKFVRLSYKNLSANAASISQYLDIQPADRAITSLPMHYVFGLSVLNSHLHAGASVILTSSSVMERSFWQQFNDRGATSLSGVPYTFELLKKLRWDRMELARLRVLAQAGGKLDATLVREFAQKCREKTIRFYVMYGAAEATARMAYLPPPLALSHPDSIGVSIPGGEMWIEDHSGSRIAAPSQVGELTYRGANVSMGYASCREDLARGDERMGVLHTGDLAKRDENDLYYIVGRKNRFVKIFGNRLNLEDVEGLVKRLGIDCACAGDDRGLRIYITSKSVQENVLSLVHERTRLHPSAISVEVIDRLPRNEVGKIAYASLGSQ